MSRLERLVKLSQPEFEIGNKTLGSVIRRRVIQKLGLRLTSLGNFELSNDEVDEFSRPAYELFRKNLYSLPKERFLRASPFHTDNWLRDSFIGTLFLEDPELQRHFLLKFEDSRTHPQIPTVRLLVSDRVWVFDDESTMLAWVWRFKLLQQGGYMSDEERTNWQERWEWIKEHVKDGVYISSAGTERSWFDTFKFPKSDVITYNQGIYAVAAIAAARAGLEDNPRVIEEAIKGYQSLTHPSGRLQLSRNYAYKDVSSLFGEFLSLFILNESILSDETVKITVATAPKTHLGYQVVAREDNSYLDPNEFNRPYKPGDYHNGAEWPMFTAIAQAVACLHGAKCDLSFWVDIFSLLRRTNHAEYVYTIPKTVEPHYNHSRKYHLWNTAVYAAAKKILNPNELTQVINLLQLEEVDRVGLYTEAAQLPGSTF